ncbi:MAG: ATP synthase F1 subunit gamma [Turicibacter sp.]|nr:ATP synthase F1 subunit gamma [Turicibacter sp.]
MAQSLLEIKNKITATENMSKITNAMEMVAAAKLAKSEAKTKNYRHYMESLEKMMQEIAGADSVKSHRFFQPSQGLKPGYLVLTSDRGLAGGYNARVLKMLEGAISEKSQDDYRLYMVGSKGFDYAKRHQLKVESKYVFVPDELIYNDIRPVISQVVNDYLEGIIDEVVVIYNDFISKIVQEPKAHRLLPLAAKTGGKAHSNHLFEPTEAAVINNLLPRYVEGTIYGIAITSKVSEFASRMNAMQNATDNAGDIIHDLRLVYNRARQAAITQEINELVGGAAAI